MCLRSVTVVIFQERRNCLRNRRKEKSVCVKAAELVQFSAAVKEERTRRAVAVARTMHRAYLEGCVGQTYPVLYEQEKDGLYTGHAPNYCEVCVRAEDLHNKIIDTKIVGIDGDVLIGELT